MEKALAAKLGLVQLRHGVVLIKDESYAEQLEKTGDQEDGVRRVASLENLKRSSRVNPESEEEFGGQRPTVFGQITQASRHFESGVAMDFNAVQYLVRPFAPASLGADDGNPVS